MVAVLDDTGALVTFNDDDNGEELPTGGFLGSSFRVQAIGQETLHVGVTSFDDRDLVGDHSESGSYGLVVGRVDPTAVGGDFGDSAGNFERAGADPISVGASGAAVAVVELDDNGDDVDFFELNLRAGDVLGAITAPVDDLPFSMSFPDTVMALLDSEGNVLVLNDDAGGDGTEFDPPLTDVGSDSPYDGFPLGSVIRALIPDDGTYYLAVSGFGDNDFDGIIDGDSVGHGEIGRYSLLVGVMTIPEPASGMLVMGVMGWMFGRRQGRRHDTH